MQGLDMSTIMDELQLIAENGDYYGYDSDEEGYYQEYKELFDEIARGAEDLWQSLADLGYRLGVDDPLEHWDDMTVALLGDMRKIYGFNDVEEDYFPLGNDYEEYLAQSEAAKRLERLTKKELIQNFGMVLRTLMSYIDLKSADDTLTAIVSELDSHAAMMEHREGKLPQRAWVE